MYGSRCRKRCCTDDKAHFSIFHKKLNARLKEIIHNAFCFKNCRQYCKFIVLSSEITHFVKHESKAKTGNRENIPEFLIDSVFVEFVGHIFQQITGILMGTNVAPSLPIFSYALMRLSLCKNTKDKHIAEG